MEGHGQHTHTRAWAGAHLVISLFLRNWIYHCRPTLKSVPFLTHLTFANTAVFVKDVNKNRKDATVCRYLFTAKLLY